MGADGLRLEAVTWAHVGVWACRAVNTEGVVQTATTLSLMGEPTTHI